MPPPPPPSKLQFFDRGAYVFRNVFSADPCFCRSKVFSSFLHRFDSPLSSSGRVLLMVSRDQLSISPAACARHFGVENRISTPATRLLFFAQLSLVTTQVFLVSRDGNQVILLRKIPECTYVPEFRHPTFPPAGSRYTSKIFGARNQSINHASQLEGFSRHDCVLLP